MEAFTFIGPFSKMCIRKKYHMDKYNKLIVGLVSVIALLTAFTTVSEAGRIQMKGRTVRRDQATTVYAKKTTNTSKIGADFKLKSGSPANISVWVYSADRKTLYAPVVTAYEDGGKTTKSYYNNKPYKKGTNIAVLYKDTRGGLGSSYEIGGYIDYY